jgi:hypothetical protein
MPPEEDFPMQASGRTAALVLSLVFAAGVVVGWLAGSDRRARQPADIETVPEVVGRCYCSGLELHVVPIASQGMSQGVYLCRTPHGRDDLERLTVGNWTGWDGIVKVQSMAPEAPCINEPAWFRSGNAVRFGRILLLGDPALLAEVCAALGHDPRDRHR